MNPPASREQLHYLASLYGIQTSYPDMCRQVQTASDSALLAVLNALGAPVSKIGDVPSAIRERNLEHWRQVIEPVITAWEGGPTTVTLKLPAALLENSIPATVTMENGGTSALVWKAEGPAVRESALIEGIRYVSLDFPLGEKLPTGYHHLKLDLPGRSVEALVVSAPRKAYIPPAEDKKVWGVFIPLYALHSRRSWGAGDLADLNELTAWVAKLGGRMVGSLPLLPSFINDRLGPGPYMPVSRLFWNEFYLDIDQIPELAYCPEARALLASEGFQSSLSKLRTSSRVNYGRQMDMKRMVLELLLECLLTDKSGRLTEFRHFASSHTILDDYAAFRAAGESRGVNWLRWPRRMREGELKSGYFSEKSRQYHRYAQWLAYEQISALSQKVRQDHLYLYLDMPVGVHPFSYDVWRERESFVTGVKGGAPPDPVFTSGQNWGFPPLHPEKLRRQGYKYIINSLRHQMQAANMLRIDHMMGFHRLFWVPDGMENREGVYVNYRAEEFYAILALESRRHQSVIIGEDLGMVPPEVRPAMEKHGIYRMYVGQYELIVENRLGALPQHSLASLNTHDMFPFTAFWQEKDILKRWEIGLIDKKIAQEELVQRRKIKEVLVSILGMNVQDPENAAEILKYVLKLLAGGPEYAFLVTLEDLWQETRPQNIPGTRDRQNWKKKALFTFEEFSRSPAVLDILKEVNRLRKGDLSYDNKPG